MLADALALPPIQLWFAVVLTPNFVSDLLSSLTASDSSSCSVVSFHGMLRTAKPAKPGVVRARVLTISGANDPYVPAEDVAAFREEMTDAGADWQVTVYGEGLHHAGHRRAKRARHGLRSFSRPPLLGTGNCTPCSDGGELVNSEIRWPTATVRRRRS